MIPQPLIGLLARILERHFTRTEISGLLLEAGAYGPEPQSSSKHQLVIDWLVATNTHLGSAALQVVGAIARRIFTADYVSNQPALLESSRAEIQTMLSSQALMYTSTGQVVPSNMPGGASPTLEELLRVRDFQGAIREFNRAVENVDSEPREAASAAANILEDVCKEYIVQHSTTLQMPSSQGLMLVFNVVKDALGLNPAT